MVEMADFIVEADSVWHSTEGMFYAKGQTITLPAATKTVEGGAVKRAEPTDSAKGKKPKADA